MKSLFNAAIGRLFFGLILLSTITTANAQSDTTGAAAGAGVVPGAGAVPGMNPVAVRYLGAKDDMLIFNVAYSNPQGNKFVITILDQSGNQVYQDNFKEKTFYRQFKLPKTDKDLITFIFRSGQDAPVEKRFAVNVNSRIVQEVAIKKL
ncbi:MAG TPA: hypothetical protein VFE32_10155 [Puia sp.]|jgi:hypothetical protein|nr:hypothetical protein [Puia sp.]